MVRGVKNSGDLRNLIIPELRISSKLLTNGGINAQRKKIREKINASPYPEAIPVKAEKANPAIKHKENNMNLITTTLFPFQWKYVGNSLDWKILCL